MKGQSILPNRIPKERTEDREKHRSKDRPLQERPASEGGPYTI